MISTPISLRQAKSSSSYLFNGGSSSLFHSSQISNHFNKFTPLVNGRSAFCANTDGIRKIRMPIAAKGKGKAGGARVITLTFYVAEEEGIEAYILAISMLKTIQGDRKVMNPIGEQNEFTIL